MNHGLANRETARAVSGADGTAGLEALHRQRAWAVVLGGELLQRGDDFLILTVSKKVFWRFIEANDGDTEDRHDKHKRTSREKGVAPAPVVCLGAGNISTVPLWLRQEAPADEACDGLPKTPPAGQEGHKPLLVTRQKLQEDGGIHDKVATTSEAQQRDKGSKTRPVGHSPGEDTAGGADEERDIEGVLATNDIGAQAPENSTR